MDAKSFHVVQFIFRPLNECRWEAEDSHTFVCEQFHCYIWCERIAFDQVTCCNDFLPDHFLGCSHIAVSRAQISQRIGDVVWFRIPQNIPNVRARWVARTAARFYHSQFDTDPPGHRLFMDLFSPVAFWVFFIWMCFHGLSFFLRFFGLLCRHTASNSITSETHTSGAQ